MVSTCPITLAFLRLWRPVYCGLKLTADSRRLAQTFSRPTCDDDDPSTGIDGWYKQFPDDRERNLGQATLLGGLLTFTTY